MCTWYCQSNLNKAEVERLKEACQKLGYEFKPFRIIPFVNRLPKLNPIPPFVLIGSTTLTGLAFRNKKYRQGIFYDPKSFKPSVYAEKIGPEFLNYEQLVLPIANITEDQLKPISSDGLLFVRSDDDSKSIDGRTMTIESLMETVRIAKDQEFWSDGKWSPDHNLIISKPKVVGREWRFIIVDRMPYTASQYRPDINLQVPDYVWYYVKSICAKWLPHSICALDVCETPDGLKVVEFNCFNGSGFYDCSRDLIVQAVSAYQERQ